MKQWTRFRRNVTSRHTAVVSEQLFSWSQPRRLPWWQPVRPPHPFSTVRLEGDLTVDGLPTVTTIASFVAWFQLSQAQKPTYPTGLDRFKAAQLAPATGLGTSSVPLDPRVRMIAGRRLVRQLKTEALSPAGENAVRFRSMFPSPFGHLGGAVLADRMTVVANGKVGWPPVHDFELPSEADLVATATVHHTFPDVDLWNAEFPARRPETADVVVYRLAEMCNALGVEVPMPVLPASRTTAWGSVGL